MTHANPVLNSAYHIHHNSTHVSLSSTDITNTASDLLLAASTYTTSDWGAVPLHPTPSKHSSQHLLHWVFLVSTLNFSFWSSRPTEERFGIRWRSGTDGKDKDKPDQIWTGYWSLLAALHRAQQDQGLGDSLVSPHFWRDADPSVWRKVFKSDQAEEMPLLEERLRVIQEVGTVLCESFEGSYLNLLERSNHSALKLVDLVVSHFPCYDDKGHFAGQDVVIRKRAQILVAETWAAGEGKGLTRFDDIDELSMFADYRVPQILHSLGTLVYSPHLTSLLSSHSNLPHNSSLELEIRGNSIVVVEEIRKEMVRLSQEKEGGGEKVVVVPNAVLLDFLLWDMAKERESGASLPHHRTRSIYY